MWRVAFAELRKLRRPTLFLGTMGAVVFFSALQNMANQFHFYLL